MISSELKKFAENLLSEQFVETVQISNASSVTGGCIHNGTRLETNRGIFFMKWNQANVVGNFHAEQRGLLLLKKFSKFRIPAPILVGSSSEHAIFIMEWLAPGPGKPDFWQEFGEKLAALHRVSNNRFGLEEDNYIGALPQQNNWHEQWTDFFKHERIIPQVELATQQRFADVKLKNAFDVVFEKLDQLIPDEPPSLLHGDLWSGNFLRVGKGEPALIDPAVYFGHREAEIAFTRLFGGFNAEFYEAYHASYPLHPGWEDRIELFNLYPLMVHLNLFGQSYLPEIQRILKKYQ